MERTSRGTVGSVPARVLRDERHRRGLVEDAELPLRLVLEGGVAEDAAPAEHLVEVTHERPTVPELEPAGLERRDERLDRLLSSPSSLRPVRRPPLSRDRGVLLHENERKLPS